MPSRTSRKASATITPALVYRRRIKRISSSPKRCGSPAAKHGKTKHSMSGNKVPFLSFLLRERDRLTHRVEKTSKDDYRLFVGNLGSECDDAKLSAAFKHYTSFLKAKVVINAQNGKPRGSGFVSLRDPLEFAKALREMNGTFFFALDVSDDH